MTTCNGCFWREGEQCYLEPCERNQDGTSKKPASERCASWQSKGETIGQYFRPLTDVEKEAQAASDDAYFYQMAGLWDDGDEPAKE